MMLKNISILWQPPFTHSSSRFVELDWLRVLAFGLLVLYHTGMLYTQNWGFHFKSTYLSSDIENIMLLISPWRMGLIWFISGAALSCLLQKSTLLSFLLNRTIKILLPLFIGVWLVVPIQLYAQMYQEVGLELNYAQFYIAFFDLSNPLFTHYQAGIWPHVDVNHLWFLRSLWVFTLLLVLLLPILWSHWLQTAIESLTNHSFIWTFLGLLVPLCVLKLFWPSETFRYPMGFIFLIYGFLLTHHRAFFNTLSLNWFKLLGSFIVGYGLVVWGYQMIWLDDHSLQWQITVMDMLYTTQRLLGVLTMLGLAMRFLQQPHRLLPKLNRLVFPFYVFHQSIIIALAFWFQGMYLGAVVEFILIVLGTFTLSALLCVVLLYLPFLQPLFGIKVDRQYSRRFQLIIKTVLIMLLAPMAFQILT
jgi:hypothetical protein